MKNLSLCLFLFTILLSYCSVTYAVMGADRGRQNDYHKINTPLYKPEALRNQGKTPKVRLALFKFLYTLYNILIGE